MQDRDVSYDTVRKYIVNHPQEFKGHIGKAHNIVLDDIAVQLLETRYPLAKPIQVIPDLDARDRLAALQEKYIAILEDNNRLTQENANLMLSHHKNMLLEEELESQRNELRSLRQEKNEWMKSFKYQEEEIFKLEELVKKERQDQQKLKKELQQEKNKSWWDKLRNR